VTCQIITTGSTDNCALAACSVATEAFDCSDVGTHSRVYNRVDVNGNFGSPCNAIISVEDNIPPIALCQDLTVQLDAGGNGSISSDDIDNGSNDACGIDNVSLNDADLIEFTCAHVGAHVITMAATDNNGNVSTCTSAVTVEDNEPPEANCEDITITLDDTGNYALSAGEIDNLFDDNCGIASSSVSPNSFTCSDLGDNTVTLAVSDVNGNTNSCTKQITVIPSIVLDAGADQTVIINTGPGPVPLPCVTLNASATGGAGGDIYSWSPAAGLSSTNTATTTACPTVTTVYTVTITDAAGCFETDDVTVTVVDINDPTLPTVQNNKNKVYVCHVETCTTLEVNANASCNSPNSLCYHLVHGDQLGQCTSCRSNGGDAVPSAELKAYPNPFSATTTIEFSDDKDGFLSLDLYDLNGVLVQNVYSGQVLAGTKYYFTVDVQNLAQQIYLIRATKDSGVYGLKLLHIK
jgi:hypothetical protein